MTELELAKKQLFNFEDPLISFNGSTVTGRYLNLAWNEIYETRQKIKDAKSLEEIKNINLEVCKLADKFLDDNKDNYDSNVQHLMSILTENVVYTSNANSWIDDNIESYKNLAVSNNSEAIKEAEEYINSGKLIDEKITEQQYSEIREKTFELINKYELGSIILDSSNYYASIHFLNNLDKSLEGVTKSTEMENQDIGHEKTLSIMLAKPNTLNIDAACFFSHTNKIMLTPNSVERPQTVLHEWSHSLDYKIGSKIIPNSFATCIEEAVIDDGSKDYKAFRAIKDLTQSFMNKNMDKVNEIKLSKLNDGANKFISALVGKDYYGISKENWSLLHSEEMVRNINNYLINPKDTKYINNIEDTLSNCNLLNSEISSKLKTPTDEMKSVKSYFDDVNKNILGSESFYYLSSHFSNMARNFEYKDLEKTFGSGNGSQRDYYTQPTEMFARYFESQFFHKEVMPKVMDIVKSARLIYRVGIDKVFNSNKSEFFSDALGKFDTPSINKNYDNGLVCASINEPNNQKDIDAAKKIEEGLLKENNGVMPEGFESKNGSLIKKHISDAEWIKQYEENVKREANLDSDKLESMKESAIAKVKSVVESFRNSNSTQKSNRSIKP